MEVEVALYEGMDTVIKTLKESYMLAIVSSTSKGGITYHLARNNLLQYFSDILGREIHHSKVEKMKMIFERHNVFSQNCIYITDTLGDMREAKEHEMATIGVSWGVHPRETLEQGIPFRIVEKPEELPDAIADYFAHSAAESNIEAP